MMMMMMMSFNGGIIYIKCTQDFTILNYINTHTVFVGLSLSMRFVDKKKHIYQITDQTYSFNPMISS